MPPLDRDVTLAILIGGRARRLGGQAKHALKVGRQTILDRQLAAAADAGIRDVLLVGGEHRLDGGLRHYADVVEGGGALGGLYSALVLATTPVVLVIAGDLPFISPALLQRLAAVDQDEDAVVPRTERGWHPLCAGYRRHVAVVVKARLDRSQLRVTDLLSEIRVSPLEAGEIARLDADNMLLMNVNTPADHVNAQRYADGRA